MNYLTNRIKYEIEKHAMADNKVECCGFICKDKERFFTFRCQNVSKNPEKHFIISEAARLDASKKGEIVAFYHSHPDGSDFGLVDRVVSEKSGLDCLVYDCLKKEIRIYKPCGFSPPYHNRPHVMGLLDCLNLAIDYYKQELNLEIKSFKHDLRYWTSEEIINNPDKIKGYDNHPLKEHFINNGFIEVDSLKKHDIIVYRPSKIVKSGTGVLVYLGNDKILCHTEGNLSKVDLYGTFFRNMTVNILRHKKLI